jgi:hypothetical protein
MKNEAIASGKWGFSSVHLWRRPPRGERLCLLGDDHYTARKPAQVALNSLSDARSALDQMKQRATPLPNPPFHICKSAPLPEQLLGYLQRCQHRE